MANWTDGPEYAPTHRPDVFVEPDATRLPDLAPPDVPATAPEPPAPPHQPTYAAPDAAPLDAVAPPSAPTRDPHQAFDVASTPMTSWSPRTLPPPDGEPVPLAPPEGAPPIPAPIPQMGPDGYPVLPPPASAWGHARAPQAPGRPVDAPPPWAPQQPFPPGAPPPLANVPGPPPTWPPAPVNPGGFPQPGPAPWERPGAPRTFEPVTVGAIARNTTPAVLITLGVGALVAPLSLALLFVASVLAVRVRYRRRVVGRVFSGSILGSFLLGLIGQFSYYGALDLFTWYDASTGWAQLACLALVIVVPLIVGDAMRRGEPPEEGL